MKAMIAAAILSLSCQVMASSFTDFANTSTNSVSAKNIIVKFKGEQNFRQIGFAHSFRSQNSIIPEMNIHLLQPNPTMDVKALLNALRQSPYVEYAQIDHKVTSRNATREEASIFLTPTEIEQGPNDSEFSKQWGLGLSPDSFGIDAVSTWLTYGTGGKDANNNDIVVAVVDGGVEITHKDLKDNIWKNTLEIPGNRIDDDQNGYVDDINGWNGYNNSGSLQVDSHGTHVSGIIGAKGNNGQQVAGVNWDLKIMNVPGSSGNTSIVLRAYKYILDQKKLWLATNGQKGANIVSTNSSFGVDFANCNSGSYPAWNDIYNEMGKAGILSAAATANRDVNVDIQGDVPTGCSSPYLITVTNNQEDGKRSQQKSFGSTKEIAGYGKKSIDLAAPGTRILSTYSRNKTSYLTGTSMATPHVAGAVAYLNSIASLPLAELYLNDPGAAALEMKRMILENVTQTEQFKRETVSGGILNLNKAAQAVTQFGLGQ